jgi:zinc protease
LAGPEIHWEVLSNGLRVLLCEAHRAPVAEFQIWAQAGSADEGPDESGLAHFHEHMLFKGTARRGVGEVAGDVEGAGGRINAYTSFDITVYHATLPSDRLAVGVDVLCDAVQHAAFDPAEIEREIEVVLEEIRRSEDSPLHVLGNAVFAETYHVHPYRAPILGSPESVASIDRARLRAFFERWYAPDNLLVVATGDFDRRALLEQVRAAFSDAKPAGARRQRPAEPPQARLRSVAMARPFERTSLEFAYPAVGLGHLDAPYLDLLAFILGSGDSSRLVRTVKERSGLAERIDASNYTPLDPGCFSLSIDSDLERAGRAIEAAIAEVERLRADRVSEEELEKARANFLAMEHFERESVSGLAQKLGSFTVLAGDYRAEERYLDAVRKATPTELQRVARDYLASERLTVGAVHPEAVEGGAPALDGATIAAAVERGVERTARRFAVPVREATGPRQAVAPAAVPEIHSYRLANGASLHIVPRRDVPVVAARVAFAGGLLAEDASTSGLSSFLSCMWLRGTRGRSAADFARVTEGLAAEIDGFSGRSSLGLTLEAPSAKLDAALDLVAEILLEPAFDAEELERERRETLAAIERREDRLAQRAFLLFAETHYRTHPYRQPMLGTAQTVPTFDRDKLVAHHEHLIRGTNCSLAIAGDVDPDELAGRVSARLGDLEDGAFSAPSPAAEAVPDEIRSAELHKDRAQAHLVIGFRGLTVHDEDRFALEVISQLLAGQGGRLFLELRDRRSLAYTVNAVNVEGVAPGYFGVYIATAPEKLDEARHGLLEELKRVVDAEPGSDELERAKRYLIGNFAIDQQRNAVHAAHVALDSLYGLGPAAYHETPERIAAIDREAVLRVARRVIDLGTYTLAVVKP